MYPKLYNKNETGFIHNGLGLLTGTISAVATEELNGMFELNMEYDNEGFLADVIQKEMIIKAKANDKQDEQLFRIYSITKNHENDNLIIDAQHITYDLGNNFVEELEARNLTKRQIMEQIGASTAYPHAFNITSSNNTTQSSTSLYRTNPLQMIAGTQGSVLQIWGGQIERDNYHLIMHDRRGSDDGVLVTYKKNLTGLSAKFDISNLVTRIFPYKFIEATDDEPEKLITVPGKYIDSPHIDDYEMPYIIPVDFSHEYDIETSQDLLNASQNWFVETSRDKPKVEMEVKFEHLWETEEYKDVAALELVGMGDTITVKHSKLNVEGTAIVNRIEYDVIAEKNNAVDVGNVKAKFTDKVNSVSNIVDRVDQAEQSANQAIDAANGKNKIYYGPDEPASGAEGDLWFRVVDGEYTRTYRYDGIQWQLVISKDVADIEEVANTAKNNASEAVEKANLATSNANEAISEAQTAFDNAQDAISTADGASDLASSVNDLAQSLQGTVSGHTTTIEDMENELSRKMTTVDADAKYATQSALQQTSQSLSSDIVAVQGTVDSLSYENRNLIVRHNELAGIIDQNGETAYSSAGRLVKEFISVEPGEKLVFSQIKAEPDDGTNNNYFRYAFYDEPIDSRNSVVRREANNGESFMETVPEGAYWLRVSYYVYNKVKVEKGNKRTPYSKAPEDIQSQFSSINQTVSDITTRVGDSEDNISTLQQTSSSFATKISNAEGSISSLTQTAQGLQNRVNDAEGNISTVTQLANTLQTDLRDAEGNINTLTETATSMQRTITGVRDDLDGLEFSDRNYLKDSKTLSLSNWIIRSDGYSWVEYFSNDENMGVVTHSDSYISQSTSDIGFDFRDTEQTFSISVYAKGSLDNQTIGLTLAGGDYLNFEPQQLSVDWEWYTWSFKGTGSSLQQFRFKFEGVAQGNPGYFRKPKIQLSSKATDWSPAPEDMATQSQITQLSDNINLRVMKDDIINQINISDESILISGRRLILDGDTTVTGTFRVSNANITSIDAGKMTTGTLDAAKVSVINLNASSIKSGVIEGIDIYGSIFYSYSGTDSMEIIGGDIHLNQSDGRYVNINSNGLFGFNSSGSLRFQADSTLVTSSALGTSNDNVYLAGQAGKEGRVVDMRDVPSDGEIASYRYLPLRAHGIYGNYLEVNAGVTGNNLYLRPRSGGEVRITGANTTDAYYPLRAGAIYSNNFVTTTTSLWMGTDSAMHIVNKGYVGGSSGDPIYRDVHANDYYARAFITQSTHAYIGTDNELRVVNKGLSSIYRNVRANEYYGIAFDLGGHSSASHLYVRPALNGEVRITGRTTTDSYRPIRADSFPTGSSEQIKENIFPFEGNALSLINSSVIYDYNRKATGNRELGFIIEREMPEIVKFDHESVNGYTHRSLNTKAIQELDEKVNLTKEQLILKVADLERRINQLEAS